MIARLLAIIFFLVRSSQGEESLVAGATYYDSENTLLEVQDLARIKDNEGLGRLYSAHHISEAVTKDVPIEILSRGNSPSSPAEFRFLDSPTTYWTQSKFIFTAAQPVSNPSPIPSPTPTPIPKPAATQSAAEHAPEKYHDPNIAWHEVNGHTRWYNPKLHHPPKPKPKKRIRVLPAEPANPNVPTAEAIPKGH